MQTKFCNGVVDAKMNKSETIAATKTLETCKTISSISPLPPGVADAAKIAAEALGSLIKLAGHGSEPYQPLLKDA